MPDRIQISAVIDADLRTEFDVACARRRLKIKDALEEAIREWLDKPTAGAKPRPKLSRSPKLPG